VESSRSVAAQLLKLGTPFLFVTGYDSGVTWLEGYEGISILRKPVRSNSLKEAILETRMRLGGTSFETDSV